MVEIRLMEQDLNKTVRQLAEEHYDKVGENFLLEVEQHHDANNGWVIDVQYSFGMGYFYEEDGKTILHVSYVNGDFKSLLRYCLNLDLDKIEFKRNFSGQVRRYDYNKFILRAG
jgi:dolichyl-phosphate-mannose--protein O-mannosyl transferase